MDKEFCLNIPIQLQYDQSFPSTMPTWQSLSASMEMQNTQSPDCFLSTPPPTDHFESALSSMVSSPAASNSAMSNDNFMIRELIGKLGNICNSNAVGGGYCGTSNSFYSTPLNSPPKMGRSMPIMDHMVKETFPSLGNSIGLNSNLPAMPGDPGFAERAARFSSFGSRSFNGRSTTNLSGSHNNPKEQRLCSNLGGRNGKLQKVASSPSLKAAANQSESNTNCANEEKQSTNDQGEFCNSRENSSISAQNQAAERGSSRKRKTAASKGKTKETESQSPIPTNPNQVVEKTDNQKGKRSKSEESNGNDGGDAKTEENREDVDGKKPENQKPPEPPKEYIHVRARRGQATDSHSLAERVRREKIGERMKLLQDLVPGCNKVTGKALMLDEIINYVQSLQRQVEFLSMKLSSVNPRVEMNMGDLFSKDLIHPNCSMTHPMYPIDSLASTLYGQPHQNPLQDSVTTAGSPATAPSPMDPNQHHGLHLSLDAFSNSLPQGDLQSIVQMGFGQIENGFQAQSVHGTNPTQMKIEF